MVPLTALWLPILLAAALALVAGFLLYMVLPVHKSDFRPLPEEGSVAELLRRQGAGPGQYLFPFCPDPKLMSDPAMVAKYTQGPVGYLVLSRPGVPAIGKNLGQMFLYHIVVSFVVAYLASRTVPPGTEYLEVFRVTGTTAVLAYTAALIPGAIWFGRPWGIVAREMVDGIVWGLLTAGVFAALWPS